MMIGLIILLIVLFYFWNNKNGFSHNQEWRKDQAENALEILKERFARGEIDLIEYNERKKVLEQ